MTFPSSVGDLDIYPSQLEFPRKGHFENALHVMRYLQLKHNLHLFFDPTYPNINKLCFPRDGWTQFYGNVCKAIPPDLPTPLDKEVEICMMCESNHAGEKCTQCSCTGNLIFCNMALINWISKKQATIKKDSVFGAKFVAMKHIIEKLRELKYELCMMGVLLLDALGYVLTIKVPSDQVNQT